MSEGEDDDDKQYDPTPKRLEDARKKGEIAKSADLMTAAGYGGFLLTAVALGGNAMLALGDLFQGLIGSADVLSRDAFDGSLSPLMGGVIWGTAMAIWPLFAGSAVMVILVVIAQQAIVFAPSKIEPKLSRISPLAGAKNKFGREGLFEFGKSFAKLMIYGAILGYFLNSEMAHMVAAMALSPAMIMVELLRMTVSLMMIVMVVALVIGAADFLWQRAQHLRKNRMSRKELLDEIKSAEGDPAMKQQRRQKGMDIATNRMLADVPKADVVIVNPTHYAVALAWDRSPGSAPVCVAKGVDEIAARIRDVAAEHAIPIHSDPPTARALHTSVKVGEQISREHYATVAAAIRFAERIRRKMRVTSR